MHTKSIFCKLLSLTGTVKVSNIVASAVNIGFFGHMLCVTKHITVDMNV